MRSVRPTPSARCRPPERGSVRAHAFTAASRPQLQLLSARAAAWHASTPCMGSLCTGNASAAHTATHERGCPASQSPCSTPFCSKIDYGARASLSSSPDTGEPPQAACGKPQQPCCEYPDSRASLGRSARRSAERSPEAEQRSRKDSQKSTRESG